MGAADELSRDLNRRRRPSRTAGIVVLLLGGILACEDAGTALGGSPAEARAHADTLFFALGARFGPVEAVPGFVDARAKFARAALVPSRIFDDPVVWTSALDDTRRFEVAGRPEGSAYLIGIRDGVARPARPGEYRRSTRLARLTKSDFEWAVRDELAIGSVTPDDLARALTALYAATERVDPLTIRDGYRRALPRTAASLGRLFTLDSLVLEPAHAGGTVVSLVTTLHTKRVADEFPNLSRYLERYAGPFRFDLEVRDLQGVRWWTASKEGDRLSLRVRVHEGRLAPLEGPPRRMPDALRMQAKIATRIRIFGVGVSDLTGDVTLARLPGEKTFTVRFRDEPEWHLPPLAARLIRGPLRRPFDGTGSTLAVSVRSSGGQSLLVRDYRVTVQESAILRWFGGLGSTLLSDFRRGAEEEYDRFLGEVFAALRADAQALIQ